MKGHIDSPPSPEKTTLKKPSLIRVKGLSVAKNSLRLKSAPLNR